MEILKTFSNPYVWALLVFAIIIFISILFKEQIQKLFPRMTVVAFESKNTKFRIVFNKILNEVQAQTEAKDIKKDVETSGGMTDPEQKHEAANLTARDMVLEAWGALKQTIYSSCSALNIAMTPSTRINVALDRLVDANAIAEDLAIPMKQLHYLGQNMANDTKLRPTMEDARYYKILSDNWVDWMMLYILSRAQQNFTETEQKPLKRSTVVGGNYPDTTPGKPVATLICINGPNPGQRYEMTKDRLKIGRNENNDISIKGDDYVSGNHAFLSYENGALFLTDRNSHNGTYLNGEKVGVPLMVRQNDQIRVGESTFQVA